MDFKEIISASRLFITKLISRLPSFYVAARRFFCRGVRFIAAWRPDHLNLKHFFERVRNISASLYDRFIVRREYTVRDLAILFVLAILIGASVKMAVNNTLTIGFQDYTLAPAGTLIDLNAVQKQVLHDGGSLTLSGTPAQGKSCSQ